MDDFFKNLGNFFGGLFGGNQQRSYSGPKDDYANTDVDGYYDYLGSGDYGDGQEIKRVGKYIKENNVVPDVPQLEERKHFIDTTLYADPSEINGEAADNGSLYAHNDVIVKNKDKDNPDNLNDYYDLMGKFLKTLREEYNNPEEKVKALEDISRDNRWNQFYNYAPYDNTNTASPVAEGLRNGISILRNTEYDENGNAVTTYDADALDYLYNLYNSRVNASKAYHRKKVA